jgi:hypothetical protein
MLSFRRLTTCGKPQLDLWFSTGEWKMILLGMGSLLPIPNLKNSPSLEGRGQGVGEFLPST